MTGTASSRGMSVFDIDMHRNQEWLRRRKLRLEQVRKQSNEIAKAIRQKVINEEKARLDEYDRMSEAKFKDWKAEKIEELERKFRCALEDFGKGYKLAEAEPDPEEVLGERCRLNFEKAQIRGEIAKQEELRRKRIADDQKMSLIQRKKLIRKKEDLRSALIHSVPIKKQIVNPQPQKIFEKRVYSEKMTFTPVKKRMKSHHKEQCVADGQKKVSPSKGKRKKVVPQKSCLCRHKVKSLEGFYPSRGSDTIWINLNEIQNSSTGDSSVHPMSTKSSLGSEKIQKEKPEGVVEFYDFSSRYYRKSYKEFPHLVERIDPESEMPNARDLAKLENEEEKVEAKKKMEADTVSQERGAEALKREKINQDYNTLITKLEELNRKEKILKAQQRNHPNFLHMNDERLSERLKAKQRAMDSKFENIYYEVMSQIPRAEPPRPKPFCREGGGDFAEEAPPRPTAPPERLKTNSPATSDGEFPVKASPEKVIRKAEKMKRKRQLLLDIDKALKEGKELRKAISRTRESTSVDEGEEKGKENSPSALEEERSDSPDASPRKDAVKTTKCQECQTEDLEVAAGEMIFAKTGDDSLPVSTSTSYKSPPSVIRSYRLLQFLEYLEGMTDIEDGGCIQNNSKYNRKVDELLHDLLHENACHNKSGSKEERSCESPTLEYYVEKLLSMSRECIADLSVSSENISTPNITDLDVREANAPEHLCKASTGEDLIRKSRLDKANQLEETIKNWKRILEKNSEGASDLEDAPDCSRSEPATSEGRRYSPKICSRYEEITKKCSERISELTNMLDKVRKDKERLLSSTSPGSSLSLNKDEGNSGKESAGEDEPPVEEPRTSVLEGFLKRYDLPKPRKETVSTVAVAGSQTLEGLEDSLESWPDVMDELLKRKILTSPFKWSDGEHSSELSPVSDSQTKPSSIENVIGNFRKEISKIKPFSLLDSPAQSDSFLKSQYSFDEELFDDMRKREPPLWSRDRGAGTSCPGGQEESSVESINQALTALGLSWAKSFLRKNEESRAISSTSNSEGKCSADEGDDYS